MTRLGQVFSTHSISPLLQSSTKSGLSPQPGCALIKVKTEGERFLTSDQPSLLTRARGGCGKIKVGGEQMEVFRKWLFTNRPQWSGGEIIQISLLCSAEGLRQNQSRWNQEVSVWNRSSGFLQTDHVSVENRWSGFLQTDEIGAFSSFICVYLIAKR